MTIYKTTKTPTGVEVSHHVIHKLETTENFLEVKIGLRGYTSESDSQDPVRAISWYWEVFVPAGAVTDISAAALEVMLTSNPTSPFYGGVLLDPLTPIETVRKVKWSQIKRARDEAEFGGFTWDGSPFDSDAISQSRIQGAVQLAAMAPGFTIDWTMTNNSVRNLNREDMANVGAALGMHVAAQHAKARTLRSQIEAATTVAEVDAVTW